MCKGVNETLCHIHWGNNSNFPAVYPANCPAPELSRLSSDREHHQIQGSKVVRAPASDTSFIRKVFCTKPTANTFRWEGRYPLIYSLCSIPLKYTQKDALFFTQASDMGHSRTGAIQDHHPEYSYYINLDFGVLILACTNMCLLSFHFWWSFCDIYVSTTVWLIRPYGMP